MASTASERPSTLDDEDVIEQLAQYRNSLNKTIKKEIVKIIHENDQFLNSFQTGSSSKDIIMKTLMDFAAEASNIEELADMIGDITMNLPDLNALNSTVNAILEAPQFGDFVKNLLLVFIENLGKSGDGKKKLTADELIGEVSQTVADYVAELAVDFVKDRVMNEESEDNDD